PGPGLRPGRASPFCRRKERSSVWRSAERAGWGFWATWRGRAAPAAACSRGPGPAPPPAPLPPGARRRPPPPPARAPRAPPPAPARGLAAPALGMVHEGLAFAGDVYPSVLALGRAAAPLAPCRNGHPVGA